MEGLMYFATLALLIFVHVTTPSPIATQGCGSCGTENSTCHVVSGIFTRTSLPYGYNKVATIPQGACTINITEMFPTRNYLALRLSNGQYLINGNWVLTFTKDYAGAGAVFHYHRSRSDNLLSSSKEYILAEGPTKEPVDIMFLKQQQNMGIMYEYTIPLKNGLNAKTVSAGEKPARPQVLLKANDLNSPEDQAQGDTPVQNLDISPELRERYRRRYGKDIADYLFSTSSRQPNDADNQNDLVQGHSSGVQSQTGLGSPQLGQTQQRETQTEKPRVLLLYRNQGSNSGQQYNANSSINPSTGHRIRHGHNRRRVITEKQPPQFIPNTVDNLYPYQALNSPSVPAAPAAPQTYLPLYKDPGQSAPSAPLGQVQYPSGYNYQAQDARQPSYILSQRSGQYQQNYYPPQRPVSASAFRGPVNDQISLNLGSNVNYHGTHGVLDPSRDYQWVISGYSECSRTCGGGSKMTLIRCAKVSSQAFVTSENCDNDLRPASNNLTCNNNPCPPSWEPEEWSECSTSCGPGTQTRGLRCEQRVSESVKVPVPSASCPGQTPDTVRTCNQEKPCARWRTGNWSQCSVDCGRGQRTREVVCVSADNRVIPENSCPTVKPLSSEICDMGSCAKAWFYTEWSQQCSPTCGEGALKREVHCSANEERCHRLPKPSSTKTCQNDLPCGGKWFSGPWAQCSVTCGAGVISRDVVCMKRLGRMLAIVGDENCSPEEKPQTEKECNNEPCGAKWYMTDWAKCSRSCDTGYQMREVKCLDEGKFNSETCLQKDKPEAKRPCNTGPCPHSQIGGHCVDQFNNCRLVVQARLCYYSYYKSICCLSCRSSTHEDNPS